MTLRAVHLDDAVYRSGFTRGDVVFYYYLVADALLPQLRGRDVTVVRFPDGVAGPCVLEPGRATHLRIDDTDALVREVEHYAVELRAPASADHGETVAAVDLRAQGTDALASCCTVATWLGDALAAFGAVTVPVSDGAFGLQLRVRASGAEATELARRAVSRVSTTHPGAVVTAPTASPGARVALDVRPARRAFPTLVPYTLRAGAAPTVAAPLRWDEVTEGAAGRNPLRFGPHDVLERLELDGDLLAAPPRATQVEPVSPPTGVGSSPA